MTIDDVFRISSTVLAVLFAAIIVWHLAVGRTVNYRGAVDRAAEPRAYWAAIAVVVFLFSGFALAAAQPGRFHSGALTIGIMGGQLAGGLIAGKIDWGGNRVWSPSWRARGYWGWLAFLGIMTVMGVIMLIWP